MEKYKSRIYLLLDVGGSQLKGSVLDENGNAEGKMNIYLARSREAAETVLNNFAIALKDLLKQAPEAEIAGVGMAFPGPFDYDKGISLMRGLDKYDSIYGMPLEPEMKKRIPELKESRFCFLHDIEAFALGESWFGEMRSEKKILCLCIGTGAGSAFLEDRIALKAGEGVPEHGWVYHLPYRESIIDDYLSIRGLNNISEAVFGQSKSGKELSVLCRQNSKKAVEVWEQFGEVLRECMEPVLAGFQPDAVILGGQISKSFSYFGGKFAEECRKRKIKIHVQTETSEMAVKGLFVQMTKGGRYVKP